MKHNLRNPLLALVVLIAGSLVLAQAIQGGELPPGPTLVSIASFEIPDELSEEHEVVVMVVDLPPGVWTPLHSHAGPAVVLILEGEATAEDEAGNRTTYGPGESLIEPHGWRHRAGNETEENVRMVFTVLMPKGAEPTTVHE